MSFRLDNTKQRRRWLILSFGLGVLILCWGTLLLPAHTTIPLKNTVAPYAQALLDTVTPQKLISSSEVDLTHLARHVRSTTFTYSRRTIRTRYVSGERLSLTQVNESLTGDFLVLSKDNLTSISIPHQSVMTLDVPRSPDADASVLSFGIATKTSRLEQSLPQLQHWLPNSGAQLHVVSSEETNSGLETSMLEQGINVTIHISSVPLAKAYFCLIKLLYETRTPETEWLVLIDDDTFFPSLPYLVSHLESNYDASKEVLVAAMSDNMDQITSNGIIPYGGGGIFISVPLAASLTTPKVWDACITSYRDQGDQIVNDCLNEHSQVRPSFDLGLNQMDIRGDPSGYFESGRRLLSVHHWKTWYQANIPMAGNVSKACGFECVFQRWQFEDDTVLSNGYSINNYPDGIAGMVKLDRVEKTWDGYMSTFVHYMGPLREAVPKGQKRTAELVEAVEMQDVGVRQIYVERAGSDDDKDRVVELLWLF